WGGHRFLVEWFRLEAVSPPHRRARRTDALAGPTRPLDRHARWTDALAGPTRSLDRHARWSDAPAGPTRSLDDSAAGKHTSRGTLALGTQPPPRAGLYWSEICTAGSLLDPDCLLSLWLPVPGAILAPGLASSHPAAILAPV